MNPPRGQPSIAPRLSLPREATTGSLVRLYVWDGLVRWTHWTIALSTLILSITGIYLGGPYWVVTGEAGDHFVVGMMKVVHVLAGFAFALAVISRVIWMFAGPASASWREFLPLTKERIVGIFDDLRFHLFAHDLPHRPAGHPPLAGLAYLSVFGLYMILITTGLGLYGHSASVTSPLQTFGVLADLWGGLQMTRWIHHLTTWVLITFIIGHILIAVRVTQTKKDGTVESMVSGYKWVTTGSDKHEPRRVGPRR